MAKYQRPKNDFWITDLKSDLDIVSRHTTAGFEPLPGAIVRLRLFILLDFLQVNQLVNEQLVETIEDLLPKVALRNRHLTDDGYYFLQKYLPRWQDRMYKHTTEEREHRFLERWYEKFASSKGTV